MVGPRKAALAEESAEVEVLFANMDKMKNLTKKIQASVNRLDASGKAVQEAISPIYGNTQKLQIANTNIDRVIEAIERLRAPREQTDREERVIRAGPGSGDLRDYIASLDRTTMALADLKRTNLRSNEKAIAQLSGLIKIGNKQLEDKFRGILQDCSRKKVQPLEYVAKRELSSSYAILILTSHRESIPAYSSGRPLAITRNQRPHLKVICPTLAKRRLPDAHTTDIRGRTRRIPGKLTRQSCASVHQHGPEVTARCTVQERHKWNWHVCSSDRGHIRGRVRQHHKHLSTGGVELGLRGGMPTTIGRVQQDFA
jgi:hypothetical protein